jgi:hypothetical protein
MTIAPLAAPPKPEIDLDIQKVVFDVINRKIKGLDLRVDESLVDGSVERTMQGASTLTMNLHDPDRILLQSGMFSYQIDVKLDRFYFRLVQVQKQGDELACTFEDRVVAWLREGNTPRKASRTAMTRAEFAYSLVREVKKGGGIDFYCPELHVKQPIAKAQQKQTPTTRKAQRDPGVARTLSGLTVKGVKATSSQIRYAERALDVADSLGAPDKAKLALIEACIVESLLSNLAGGDRDSAGILQVRASTAKPMGISNTDVEACCNAFLTKGFTGRGGAISLARSNPGMSAGQIAQAVQGSAYPTRYDGVVSEAQKFVDGYQGGADSSARWASTAASTVVVPYQFQRGGTAAGQTAKAKESTWDALQRLASEVQWACFVSENVCYFISEPELAKAKPSMIISEKSPGVSGIDFDIDHGKVRDIVTVHARAARWVAAPGAVVVIEDCGPADGRWIVQDMTRGLFDPDTQITLQRPTQPLPEPAPTTTTSTPTSTSKAAIAQSALSGDLCSQLVQAADALAAKRFPYVWDGGHRSAGTADTGAPGPGYTGHTVGLDCSGSTGAVLAAVGMGFNPGDSVYDSGQFASSWGQAGEGQCLTVWANDVHVFMFIKGQHYGTGSAGNSGGFAHQPMRSTAGFTPRHWPGM